MFSRRTTLAIEELRKSIFLQNLYPSGYLISRLHMTRFSISGKSDQEDRKRYLVQKIR